MAMNPGPGKYHLDFNIEELLSHCDDKKLVHAILENIQERKPTSVFQSKEPKSVVFDVKNTEDGV
jgi:hypothetical protein